MLIYPERPAHLHIRKFRTPFPRKLNMEADHSPELDPVKDQKQAEGRDGD